MANSMKKFDLIESFDSSRKVVLDLSVYQTYGNLRVDIYALDEEFGIFEPYTNCTVNVDPLPYLAAAIHVNIEPAIRMDNAAEKRGEPRHHLADFAKMDPVFRLLVDNEIAEPTGMMIPSGFCVFPVFKFNEEVLREIDPQALMEYQKAKGVYIEKPADEKIGGGIAELSVGATDAAGVACDEANEVVDFEKDIVDR